MLTDLKIIARLEDFGDALSLYAREVTENQMVYMGDSITMRQIEPGDRTKPFVRLDKTQAQILMDSLWSCGIRPSEGSGSAGSLAATERHLADMQRIAFTLLPKGKT